MFESKYGKVLTVILVIVIIAIIVLLSWLGYNAYKKYVSDNDAKEFVDNFIGEVGEDGTDDGGNGQDLGGVEASQNGGNGNNSQIKTYKGFVVLGTIEIPKTDVKYPILDQVQTKTLDLAVVKLYGVGINQVGNVVIIGHNYRNGQFFSDNKKLENGDKIYITDNSGKKLSYTIYNKFQATPEETSFYSRDTNGVPEITLSSCTDDSKNRVIIEARAES